MPGRVGWLEKFLKPEADRAERRRVEQFAAFRWNGSSVTEELVRDISSSGLYLLTKERWQRGTVLALTLQRRGPLDHDPARRITTQVKVTRVGSEGVGLSFLWSKDDPESQRWESLLESLIGQTKPAEMQSLVKMVEAFAFLGRICAGGAEEIGEWVGTRASSHKVQNAVSILLKAESKLGHGLGSDGGRINPVLALGILEVGSGTDEDWLQGYWAGLLAASVSGNGTDATNLKFIELLGQLRSIPTRVLTVVCTRAHKVISESGVVSAEPLACDLEEMVATVGSRGSQIEQDLGSLSALQLIEPRTTKGPTLLKSSHTYITPTSLGLQLFALCHGHRGHLRDFYLSGAAEIPEHVHAAGHASPGHASLGS
jgi:hypothetical protein